MSRTHVRHQKTTWRERTFQQRWNVASVHPSRKQSKSISLITPKSICSVPSLSTFCQWQDIWLLHQPPSHGFSKKKTGQIDTFQESPWLFTRDPYGLWYNPHITGWYNPRCNNLNNQGPKLFIAQLTPTELVENQKRTTMSHATMRFNCRHQDV